MKPAIITFELTDVTFEQVERCRLMIHRLFEESFFSVKNGSFTAHFDELGNMATTELKLVRKANKPLETKYLVQYKVSSDPVNKSTIAERV